VYPAKNFATLDHIIPLDAGVFRGGFHSYANCQTLCLSCNSRKGARIS
jgi:5-methylcytosine-specific restriction endonuclease McrA